MFESFESFEEFEGSEYFESFESSNLHPNLETESPTVSSSIFVSSGCGSRLLTERAEVVGGLTAAAGAMPYRRPRVRLPRWAGCAAVEMH